MYRTNDFLSHPQERPLLFLRGDEKFARRHAWFEIEQDVVTRFVRNKDLTLPLSRAKKHDTNYTIADMVNFESRGQYHVGREDDMGDIMVRMGRIKG